MDRLDLELYADRLSRHSDRLCDEIAAARLRQAWCELEHGARDRLGASRCAVLEAIGVLAGDPVVGDDASLIARREVQLAALTDLQRYVEERIAALTAVAG